MGSSARSEPGPAQSRRFRAGVFGLVVAVAGVAVVALLWQWLSGGSGDASAAPVAVTTSAATPVGTEIVSTTWRSGVEVTATVAMGEHDSCQQSLISARPDAYRCFAGDVVHDPCFTSPRGVVCPELPWARRATLLQLAVDPAPGDGPIAAGLPWGIELADGQRCAFLGGATDLVDDLRANYGCDHGTVYGAPTGDPQWMVRYRPEGTDRLTTVAVTTAWF
jgi:hypothetical protein